ncbi:glycosyltransferase family 39 protein [Candidatus Saccharibacteria bacterium]|nr:glycosyltransferase family 39 protein [Candidatus Saccharibacteria bacterium]
MKKHRISSLFLYKHRWALGFGLLGVIFIALIFLIPLLSPNGISEAEMRSAVNSVAINRESIFSGEIVDLPYHALQKASIKFLGLSAYSIKLPSIAIGLFLGLLLILLLNRWFKNNVALISSILTVVSAPFLYLVGTGTPLIMLVFWPTLLLWLGSKIQGVKKPRASFCFLFALALFVSVFTPYMLYLAIFIFVYAIVHPHLRFTIKSLPTVPFILAVILALSGFAFIGYNIFKVPETLTALLFAPGFELKDFLDNLKNGFLPFFSWTGSVTSTLLSPMLGLASVALAITGLISTTKGFFASRNSIASLFIIFTVLLTGINPDCAILVILPFAILTAHGVRYILEKWYGLFPENPYARIFAIFPVGLLIGILLASSTFHYIFGYRYNPAVANEFQNDLSLVYENVEPDTTLLVPGGTLDYDFYHILEETAGYQVKTAPEGSEKAIATLGKWPEKLDDYDLYRIITSPKSTNSDRIYIYK